MKASGSFNSSSTPQSLQLALMRTVNCWGYRQHFSLRITHLLGVTRPRVNLITSNEQRP
nr:hypothetical protein BgiMline_011511 [Biomphalaria glabrata]